ncbi:MAG: hypothetical protein WCI88_10265 [Chloroflexota bacterium]
MTSAQDATQMENLRSKVIHHLLLGGLAALRARVGAQDLAG